MKQPVSVAKEWEDPRVEGDKPTEPSCSWLLKK
uniref:Uncharacterized protein n=1 Tax=Anguilla anguilla TaxID=7936 RepID=A0A0E9TDF5_ANGAN